MARTKIPKGFAKAMTTVHGGLYRALGGRFVGGMGDVSIHLLTTTGRRTGRRRTVPLIMIEHERGFVAIASYSGHDTHPAWYLNLRDDPHGVVTSGTTAIPVIARDAAGTEREALWQAMADVYPDYDEYAAVTDRVIPVVILEPVD